MTTDIQIQVSFLKEIEFAGGTVDEWLTVPV